MESHQGAEGAPKSKRTPNACIACRQSKIKCSGKEPCANCQRRGVACQFADANKVVIDESYLQKLLSQARQTEARPQSQSQSQSPPQPQPQLQPQPIPRHREPSAGEKRSAALAFDSTVDFNTAHSASTEPHKKFLPPDHLGDQERSVWTNPFTLPSTTVNAVYKGKIGWSWLAPTSLWSLTTRLSLMMVKNLDLDPSYKLPSSSNQEVGLPSIDDAHYLFNTVKHHLDQQYHFFDEDEFRAHLNEFYCGNSLKKATEDRLWFVQYLLVLAFGNAFLLRFRKNGEPPGSKYFLRAMALLPDYNVLWTQGIQAVQTIALAGLYLYSCDHRELANVYIGQAIRIAQLDGLHTELPEAELGTKTVKHCRHLWWTLYVLDRHISSSLGLPMAIRDEDITTVMTQAMEGSPHDATLCLHVKLSYLFTSILSSIYKNEKTELGTFLEKTRMILQKMTLYAREIEDIVSPKSSSSVEAMSKGTRYIILLYHQCVVVATRPLLLSVLKGRLEWLEHRQDDWESFLAPTKALISTGIKSAIKTLQILRDEDSLLEVFLPFEMEVTYGAALHLMMANTLFPHATEGQRYDGQEAHAILDEMISKGNMLAAARKTDLTHLEGLFRELAIRIERYGLQELYLATPDDADNIVNAHRSNIDHLDHSSAEYMALDTHAQEQAMQSYLSPSHVTHGLEILDDVGISSYEFLSIIEQIGGAESSLLDLG
ncbi:hypothetical protein N7533_012514 [Penicillium manginii]|uniref:uncharacterized protein n=1 Tax=Penicillium manginii TaxID=203109 RepID=UPI002549063D|nr:uncharacterized protein N7533_012514 [Penicillium manginii]KAJ5739730.1 hypothetical protein N7533_012514 [Penicillium manginii]